MRISTPPSLFRALAKTRLSVEYARASAAGLATDYCSAGRSIGGLFVIALYLLSPAVALSAEDQIADVTRGHGYSFNFTGATAKPSPNAKAGEFAKRTLFLPPHATLLPDGSATELQNKIVEPSRNPAHQSDVAGLTLPQVPPPLPSQRPKTATQKHLARRASESDARTAILSEDAISSTVAQAERSQVMAAAPGAELGTVGGTTAQTAESVDADAAIAQKTGQSKPQKTAKMTTEYAPAKSEVIATVPKPVIIQQQTASTVILTSSQAAESDIPTTSRSDAVGASSSPAKSRLPASDRQRYSTSSDVEADVAIATTNDEIAKPAIADTATKRVNPRKLQTAALSRSQDEVDREAAAQTAVPLPEAKPQREELKRRALARKRAQRRRAARRRAALARAKAKAGQAQSAPASLLPNWIGSALQIDN